MQLIRQKDKQMGEKGRKFLEENMVKGMELRTKFNYVVHGDDFSKERRMRMISNDLVTLIGRKDNSFYVKTKIKNKL